MAPASSTVGKLGILGAGHEAMSKQNVEIIRGAFDAFNGGDLETVVAMCDPAVEWRPPAELPAATAYHGHEGVREAIGDMLDTFSGLQAEPERVIEAGDQVVVLFLWRGHGKGSGLSLERFGKQAAVFTMRDGKAIRVDWYLSKTSALEAAGLSEQEAHS